MYKLLHLIGSHCSIFISECGLYIGRLIYYNHRHEKKCIQSVPVLWEPLLQIYPLVHIAMCLSRNVDYIGDGYINYHHRPHGMPTGCVKGANIRGT